MRITEPLLCAKFDPSDPKQFEIVQRYLPLLASYKLDGVRAIVQDGMLLSRSFKLIPNEHTRRQFSKLEGLDGELIIGEPTSAMCYKTTVSGVMRKLGVPSVRFFVFDQMSEAPFAMRVGCLPKNTPPNVVLVRQHFCVTWQDVLDYEAKALAMGYEGLVLRSQTGPYKQGRSTLKEGYAIKLKRFVDAEAEVIGMTELQHNLNEQTTNELGRSKRSSHKENKEGADTMGSLQVRDLKTKVEFEIGTGFTEEEIGRAHV
jgi:DNA ligase-1